MRIATVKEAQTLDEKAQAQGLSGESLMEAAGALAAHEIRHLYRDLNLKGFIAVVAGPGGNGGDGLVIARHLESAGFGVRVFLSDADSGNALFKLNLSRLPKSVTRFTSVDVSDLSEAALIVDALLGVGLSRTVSGTMKLFIDEMNRSKAVKVSVDTPSGLDADRGEKLGASVIADFTLTFSLAKRGFFTNEGPRHVGRLKVLPIGFPRSLVREVASTQTAFGEQSAKRVLPKRKSSSNKSTSGHTALFAGRPGFVGASLLAGLGASRVGSGYVSLITRFEKSDRAARIEIAQTAPEFLTMSSEDDELWKKIEKASVIIGPGFGTGEATLKILQELHARKFDRVVVDADALTALSTEKKKSKSLPVHPTWILTPHAGELSRLVGGDARDLEARRFEAAEAAARELGCILLFKGFRTVISDGERTCVILSGNSALSKAGSGDTLSGLIGGLLAQKVEPFEAACLGAYLHGRVADDWLRSGRDVLSFQPSDFAQALPLLLKKIRSSSSLRLKRVSGGAT